MTASNAILLGSISSIRRRPSGNLTYWVRTSGSSDSESFVQPQVTYGGKLQGIKKATSRHRAA
jgi:hypothetical protein